MFHVYYNSVEHRYMLRDTGQIVEYATLAIFYNFDMAYDYVTKLNGSQHLGQTYSRWTINR